MSEQSYEGHRNWTHWNVSLWVRNDEGLYNLAKQCLKVNNVRADAAEEMLEILQEAGTRETPDGAVYSKTAIRAAMVGL